jgi:hypothetical protein
MGNTCACVNKFDCANKLGEGAAYGDEDVSVSTNQTSTDIKNVVQDSKFKSEMPSLKGRSNSSLSQTNR